MSCDENLYAEVNMCKAVILPLTLKWHSAQTSDGGGGVADIINMMLKLLL